MEKARSSRDLRVFQAAFEAAMRIFEISRCFPKEEQYSLTDQIRRSSRSVCANIGEAWRKRRYPAHFCSKLSDAEAEAEETLVWVLFAERCGYMQTKDSEELRTAYDHILGQLVAMIVAPGKWKL